MDSLDKIREKQKDLENRIEALENIATGGNDGEPSNDAE